jgi:hypothetical protein
MRRGILSRASIICEVAVCAGRRDSMAMVIPDRRPRLVLVSRVTERPRIAGGTVCSGLSRHAGDRDQAITP